MSKSAILFLFLIFASSFLWAQGSLMHAPCSLKGIETASKISNRFFEREIAQQIVFSPSTFVAYTGPAPTQLAIQAATRVPLYPTNELLTQRFKMWPTHENFIRGVFQSRPENILPPRPTGTKEPNMFSGTIFRAYDGKIYGVTAAHAIADHIGDQSLQRSFTADVYVNGRFLSVPAEIIQVSAPSTLDLALVKFPPEVESWLTPFEISTAVPLPGDVLKTQGFSVNRALYLSERPLLSKNLFYLRAVMELSPTQRRGLCGSPVINAEGKLVGVHIGSAEGKKTESMFVGYATQAVFLNSLVQAYHNDGKLSVPFVLLKQKIVDLNIDEYIAYVRLLDADGSVVWYKMLTSKFPYREVEEIATGFSPRYLEIAVGRVSWDGKLLTEEHGLIPADATWYRYDFRTGQTGKIK
ncbi:MAG: trypsin-like peptidase domain-containing protein [Elusimicrobiaceae bacterium]|nr:trypsin-like peptidase domain-containing protein [Elusimicrobiaceae bacterium]